MYFTRTPETIGSTAESAALRPISRRVALSAMSVPPEIAMYGTTAVEAANLRRPLAIITQDMTQPPWVWSTSVSSSPGRCSIASSTISATRKSITGVMMGITVACRSIA